jgi:predicted nucleic acid-binding protein
MPGDSLPDTVIHLYWDTNVFVAYLNDERDAYGFHVDHIGQYLGEAKEGKCLIYTSALTIAEIPKRRLVKSHYGSFTDFLRDYEGIIVQVAADPAVMVLAAEIKNLHYEKTGGVRDVGTPDAIHLASALSLDSVYEVRLTAFHTFDNGKGKSANGKAVPLLSYEEWCGACRSEPAAQRVISLQRTRPVHPNPRLFK